MKNLNIQKIAQIIYTFAAIISIFAILILFFKTIDKVAGRQHLYELQNNCRYENGLCYTYEERGYLFDKCATDADCQRKWGL